VRAPDNRGRARLLGRHSEDHQRGTVSHKRSSKFRYKAGILRGLQNRGDHNPQLTFDPEQAMQPKKKKKAVADHRMTQCCPGPRTI